jgi:hypothetical protein
VNRAQLEVEIEEKHCKLARKAGWVVDKIMKTGRGGFPDRFYAREGRVVLIEFKKPKGTDHRSAATAAQGITRCRC